MFFGIDGFLFKFQDFSGVQVPSLGYIVDLFGRAVKGLWNQMPAIVSFDSVLELYRILLGELVAAP